MRIIGNTIVPNAAEREHDPWTSDLEHQVENMDHFFEQMRLEENDEQEMPDLIIDVESHVHELHEHGDESLQDAVDEELPSSPSTPNFVATNWNMAAGIYTNHNMYDDHNEVKMYRIVTAFAMKEGDYITTMM